MSNPPTPGPSPTTLTAANKDILSFREEFFSDSRRSARSPILNDTSHQGGKATRIRIEGLEVRVLGGPGPIVPAGVPGVLGAILVGYLVHGGIVGYLIHGIPQDVFLTEGEALLGGFLNHGFL